MTTITTTRTKTRKKRRRTTNKRRDLIGSVWTVALILACASSLPAQKSKDDSNTRTIQGTVFDPDGSPVELAVVELKDTRTLTVMSFITQKGGAYHFAGLRFDTEYQIKAVHQGLTMDWKRLSIFDPRKVAVMNLKLDKKEPEKKEPEKP